MVASSKEKKINYAQQLRCRIEKRSANVAVVGLGYVGLPLAVALAKAGFTVTGIERKRQRRVMVNSGENYIADISGNELRRVVKQHRLIAVASFSEVKKADVICICVPTPLKEDESRYTKRPKPDLFYVKHVSEQISKYMRPGQLIILESTTYPGTTEELVLSTLKKSGLKVGGDFFLAFSPERVDPGNQYYRLKNTPKVFGGITKACTELTGCFYKPIVGKLIPVSSPRVAEMEKLLENVFRNINIAFVNELAMICHKMKINVWEVIGAASTKPYGFMPFYPGPGIGGHCIPLDPFYLSWKARQYGINAEFIELATQFNNAMPGYIVDRLEKAVKAETGESLQGKRILVLGLAYKRDISDWRESPSLLLINELLKKKAKVACNDPYVPSVDIFGKSFHSSKLTDSLISSQDAVIIATDHSCYDYRNIIRRAKLVFDTRNVLSGLEKDSNRIITL